METSANITAAVFAAHLKCPTKAYLMAHDEKPPDNFVTYTCGRLSAAYKSRARHSLGTRLTGVLIDFLQLTSDPARETATLFVDCETASYTCARPMLATVDRRAKRSERRCDVIPILYSAWDKRDQADNL